MWTTKYGQLKKKNWKKTKEAIKNLLLSYWFYIYLCKAFFELQKNVQNHKYLLVFVGKICLQASQVPVLCGRITGKEVLSMLEKSWVKDHLGMMSTHQFIGQAGMLAGAMEGVLPAVLEKLWWLGNISDGWEQANIPMFMKGHP